MRGLALDKNNKNNLSTASKRKSRVHEYRCRYIDRCSRNSLLFGSIFSVKQEARSSAKNEDGDVK